MRKICDKNSSSKKYEKLGNCLFKANNSIKLFLEKGSSLQ